jgi:DNA-binding transcriptional MocR family regulator
MPEIYLPEHCSLGGVTYKTLSEHIKSLIISGVLPSGTSLPSIRDLSRRLEISGLTVQRAYADLARWGYTEAATNRGTWVANRSSQLANQEGEHLGSFLLHRSLDRQEPDPELFDAQEFCSELSRLRNTSKETWSVSPPYGAGELLAQITRLLRSYGMPASGDQLLVTLGARHACSLVASLFSGRRVLLEDPRTAGLKATLAHAGVECIPYRRTERGVSLSEISKLCDEFRPAAIFISPLFHCPTGTILETSISQALLKLARQKGVLLVEMDLHREISFERNLPPPLAVQEEGVLYIGAFDTVVTSGLQLGFVRCPSTVRSAMHDSMVATGMIPSLPLQVAMANFMANGGYQRHLARAVPKYRARRDAMVRALSMYLPNCQLSDVKGGLSAWAFLPHGQASLWNHSRSFGVEVGKGSLFSDQPSADAHASLSFASLSPESIKEAVRLLASSVEPCENSA